MDYIAENVHRFRPHGLNIQNLRRLDPQNWERYNPLVRIDESFGKITSFKPGVSDRLLMTRIVGRILDTVRWEDYPDVCVSTSAMNIMGQFYWPRYSWWDERCLEEAKRYK
jgi:hypothetical protein